MPINYRCVGKPSVAPGVSLIELLMVVAVGALLISVGMYGFAHPRGEGALTLGQERVGVLWYELVAHARMTQDPVVLMSREEQGQVHLSYGYVNEEGQLIRERRWVRLVPTVQWGEGDSDVWQEVAEVYQCEGQEVMGVALDHDGFLARAEQEEYYFYLRHQDGGRASVKVSAETSTLVCK